jgi:hypothetical protein
MRLVRTRNKPAMGAPLINRRERERLSVPDAWRALPVMVGNSPLPGSFQRARS